MGENNKREVADALRMYEQKFSSCGIASPCSVGADFHCPDCDLDVRGVVRDNKILLCPICGNFPGALALGRGPTN